MRDDLAPESVAGLVDAVRRGAHGLHPDALPVSGAFWVGQSTQFPDTQQKYRNYYLLLRVGAAFGACCVEHGQLDPSVAEELSGCSVGALLRDARLPVRIAALDAFLSVQSPHANVAEATPITLPRGTPVERAIARDEAIASLLPIAPGQRVGLIGVVNPLVAAIQRRGATCLPCDFNMERTQDGQQVAKDMAPILDSADLVIATGMTLSNGSFDRILATARRRGIPLVIFAQTGSAIVARFVGHGVSALSAEPFPFSQFSAEPTSIYLYRANARVA